MRLSKILGNIRRMSQAQPGLAPDADTAAAARREVAGAAPELPSLPEPVSAEPPSLPGPASAEPPSLPGPSSAEPAVLAAEAVSVVASLPAAAGPPSPLTGGNGHGVDPGLANLLEAVTRATAAYRHQGLMEPTVLIEPREHLDVVQDQNGLGSGVTSGAELLDRVLRLGTEEASALAETDSA